MKVTWEAADILCGRRIGSTRRTERYMIGYDPAHEGPDRYALVSLSDGMIARAGLTAETCAEFINSTGDIPSELLPPTGEAQS